MYPPISIKQTFLLVDGKHAGPKCVILQLQRVQNADARLTFGLQPQDHVTSALQQLHWLPIHYRIQYKLCLLM